MPGDTEEWLALSALGSCGTREGRPGGKGWSSHNVLMVGPGSKGWGQLGVVASEIYSVDDRD